MRLQKLKPNRRESRAKRERIIVIVMITIIIRIRDINNNNAVIKNIKIVEIGWGGVGERFIHNKDASILASRGRGGWGWGWGIIRMRAIERD
jgi:hypothetical protein